MAVRASAWDFEKNSFYLGGGEGRGTGRGGSVG